MLKIRIARAGNPDFVFLNGIKTLPVLSLALRKYCVFGFCPVRQTKLNGAKQLIHLKFASPGKRAGSQ